MENNKTLKHIAIAISSLVLFLIATIQFNFFSIEQYFFVNTYIQLGLEYIIFCVATFLITLIYIAKDKKIFFAVLLILVTAVFGWTIFQFTGAYTIYLSAFFALGIVFITLNSIVDITNYINTPTLKIATKISSNTGLVLSIIVAFTFYSFTEIDLQNPTIQEYIDSATEVAVQKAIDLNPPQDSQILQDGLQQLQDLGITLTEQNLNTTQLEDTVRLEVKNQIYELYDQYEKVIKIIVAFSIFGYLRFFFGILSVITTAILTIITKLLVMTGFLVEKEETVQAKRISF